MTDWGLVFFLACGAVAVVLLVVALCSAAGSADRRLEEMAARREGARVYDFPERRRQ